MCKATVFLGSWSIFVEKPNSKELNANQLGSNGLNENRRGFIEAQKVSLELNGLTRAQKCLLKLIKNFEAQICINENEPLENLGFLGAQNSDWCTKKKWSYTLQ